MSQITRCPSCSTSFKVVADQLRISEGWVRCGQCKEVFDASAHLLPAAPPSLLPHVSLTDVRPPSAPVARKADVGRAWGAPPEQPPPEAPPPPPSAEARREALLIANEFELASLVSDHQAAALHAHSVPAPEPVLDVPDATVPAFLSADATGAVPPREAPFSWRARRPSNVPLTPPESAISPSSAPVGDEDLTDPPPPDFGVTQPAELSDLEPFAVKLPAAVPVPPVRPESAPVPDSVAAPAPTVAVVGAAPSEVSREHPAEDLPSVEFVREPAAAPSKPVALTLAEDDSPASVLQAKPRKAPAQAAAEDAGAEEEEVSFVRAARRKAFWRRPTVRAVLVVVAMAATVALALQVVVQERHRIAATDARARPWLMTLCEPLRCDIAPQRQIADVVIDSSSFNKARGDSYQLALAMKSRAGIPLAVPAVELTLTDAQDQPVLRRVLLPADMGAPAELPARGEWTTSVSVIVTTGGARVAGYRVLAFYP